MIIFIPTQKHSLSSAFGGSDVFQNTHFQYFCTKLYLFVVVANPLPIFMAGLDVGNKQYLVPIETLTFYENLGERRAVY